MKTTVVPAQITTVEDRVAGSFTLIQITLLTIPLVLGSAIFAVLMPRMHSSPIKSVLIISQLLFFCLLALRIGGKIVAEWLVVYLNYSLRPRRYVFSKNDPIYRDIIIEKVETEKAKSAEKNQTEPKRSLTPTFGNQLKFDRLFQSKSLSVSFKLAEKGGVDVSLQQVES